MMNKRLGITRLILILMTCFLSSVTYAQDPSDTLPPDPAAIHVFTIQNLQFGVFAQGGSGGTITVSNSGGRSATGSIILINQGGSFFQCIIDVEAAPGSLISITNGADATLTGSNGGTVTLVIGNSNPTSPFNTTVSPPARTPVNIGGTLTVGNSAASPPGNYTGVFYITFNQE